MKGYIEARRDVKRAPRVSVAIWDPDYDHEMVPQSRIRVINTRPLNANGDFVLYWMTMARRTRSNYGLERAVRCAKELKKPLLVLEALRCDYPDASDRFHQFLLDGMRDNAAAMRRGRALYYPYVEPAPGAGRGLLQELSARACVVVTDYYPAYFLPRMLKAAAAQSGVRLEAVDSNGLLPLAAADGRAFPVARSYRAFVQRELPAHLAELPEDSPLSLLGRGPRLASVPTSVLERWPAATPTLLRGGSALSGLPIDHTVPPVATPGGPAAAARQLKSFVTHGLGRYNDERNHPDADATSHLSPYLHFGHISAHEVFHALMNKERWTTRRLGRRAGGKRDGWWGVSPGAEAFLDQLAVWRELAFNSCENVPRFDEYDSLPDWARQTLGKHQRDKRPHQYDQPTLEAAETHDDVWNAAQRQMVRDGWFHGYMRMLWGKKILEWSPSPEAALTRMQSIMNRYALDGRDPNSYAGYAWVLGRYDRPWPERPIFGTVRYMTSASARRKLKLREYLERYGAG
jgi:deoxyribodipyrimidine photo-lyase